MQVFQYFHKFSIVLIPAHSREEADRKFKIQYGSCSPVQSNVYEVKA